MHDAVAQCTNQVMAFFRHLDECNYGGLVQLLHPDAEWHRQGVVLRGHAAVSEAMSARSKTMRIHHLICNLVADRLNDDVCEMRAYMLVVRHDDGTFRDGAAPLTGIENIRTTRIRLRRSDSSWLIANMINDAPTFAVEH